MAESWSRTMVIRVGAWGAGEVGRGGCHGLGGWGEVGE